MAMESQIISQSLFPLQLSHHTQYPVLCRYFHGLVSQVAAIASNKWVAIVAPLSINIYNSGDALVCPMAKGIPLTG